MKKINSIGYGHKVIGAAAIFLVVIPVASFLISVMAKQTASLLCVKMSLTLGFMILLFLIILLTIELFQDKRRNEYFESNKNVKIALKNGLYECQTCGNRQVKLEHRNCNVCGVYFKI